MFAKLTLVFLLALWLSPPAGAGPVSVEPEDKSDAVDDFAEKNRTSYKGADLEVTPGGEDEEYPARDAGRTAATELDGEEVCMDLEDVLWYYLLPALVYFFAAVLALGLVLVLVHCVLCMRKMCPRMLWCCPCEIGIFHRTTVAEEKEPNCRTKEKLQLSLVNVNKHYYRLDGVNSPN